MSDWNENFLMSNKALGFLLREHKRISDEEFFLFWTESNAENKLGKTIDQSIKELSVIILKIMRELRLMLEMLEDTDIYQDEYDKIKGDEKYYTADFPEFECVFREKIRKYGIIKFLIYYQNRYDTFCAKSCGENRNKIDINKLILGSTENT